MVRTYVSTKPVEKMEQNIHQARYKLFQRKKAKARAATPVAPRTPGTTIRPPPLLLPVFGVGLLVVTVEVDDADFGDVLDDARTDAEVLLLAARVVVADATEAGTDDPLTSAWTMGLNVPVMALRAKWAENASTKKLG